MNYYRYHHPHPNVQRRMEVLCLVAHGATQAEAARLADVSLGTVKRHTATYFKGGLSALLQENWYMPTSKLSEHTDVLKNEFTKEPPRTINEACERIETLTGVKRRPTQVRAFLKKVSA